MKSLSMCVKKPKKMRKLEKKVRMKRRKFISLYIFFSNTTKSTYRGSGRIRKINRREKNVYFPVCIYMCVCVILDGFVCPDE